MSDILLTTNKNLSGLQIANDTTKLTTEEENISFYRSLTMVGKINCGQPLLC